MYNKQNTVTPHMLSRVLFTQTHSRNPHAISRTNSNKQFTTPHGQQNNRSSSSTIRKPTRHLQIITDKKQLPPFMQTNNSYPKWLWKPSHTPFPKSLQISTIHLHKAWNDSSVTQTNFWNRHDVSKNSSCNCFITPHILGNRYRSTSPCVF